MIVVMDALLSSKEISKSIKDISIQDAILDYQELENIAKTKDPSEISERCRIGNNLVDIFTFEQRIHKRGKYRNNYIEEIFKLYIELYSNLQSPSCKFIFSPLTLSN